MRPAAAAIASAIVGGVIVSSGCTYYNTIYNAERVFARAEASRRAGQDTVASALYTEVIRKTSDAYRARPETEWAVDALYLLGRSRYRLGEHRAALGALEAAEPAADPELQRSIRVYRAAVLEQRGERSEALDLVNRALDGPLRPAAKAEAHLLRGAWLLEQGRTDLGWWDLDRAAEADREVRVEAAIARLRWSIRHDDIGRARAATTLLLSYPEAGTRIDLIEELLDDATEQWGEGIGADLLAEASSAAWERESRGLIRIRRAQLLHAAGDTTTASSQAWAVARTLGDAAAEARLQIARWHLQSTEDIADAYAVRPILLPVGTHPGAARLVDAVDELEIYTDVGLEEPLGWFAAAEVARDRLGADYLARGLFLAYVAGAPDEPWAPKALMAAMEVSSSEGDRAWLRGRLEAHARSPYVLAAHGQSGAGIEALEEELQVRLRDLRAR